MYFFEEEMLTKQTYSYRLTQLQLHNFSYQLSTTRAHEAFTDEAKKIIPDVTQISDEIMQIYREELYRIKSEQVRVFSDLYQPAILAFYDRIKTHLQDFGYFLAYLSPRKVHIAAMGKKQRYTYFDLVFSKGQTPNEWYDLLSESHAIEVCFYGAKSRVHHFEFLDLFSFLEKAPEWRILYARKKGFKAEIDELVQKLTPIAEILKQTLWDIEQKTGKPFQTLYKPEED